MALQKRSYRLFRWMTEAIDRGFIRHETATKYASLPEATSDWITSHYNDIPLDAKPEKDQLQDFLSVISIIEGVLFRVVEGAKDGWMSESVVGRLSAWSSPTGECLPHRRTMAPALAV